MNRYTKKPVTIEAFQMTVERRKDNRDWPSWLNEAWQKEVGEVGQVSPRNYPHSDGTEELFIRTLEGLMLVSWDDFIIRGVKGEIYACKPDVFAMTYEPATEEPATTDKAIEDRAEYKSEQRQTDAIAEQTTKKILELNQMVADAEARCAEYLRQLEYNKTTIDGLQKKLAALTDYDGMAEERE